MNKDKKMLLGVGIVFLFLATVGFSYAYFSNAIANKDVKDQVVQTGTLELTYTDGPEIIMNIIKPGATITKEISVKNTGTLDTSYNLVWQELVNEIIKDEIVIEATCTRLNANGVEEGTCENLETTPIGKTKIKENITIEPNIVHKYDITITFKEINEAQNYNQGKKFSGVLGVKEYKTPEPVYCTFDGELTQGAEYVNGQYTYRYKQEGVYASSGLGWNNITTDGWGVQLTDRTSTEPVTSKLCTYINDKTVVSMSWMFLSSQATTIDLSSFNTSNVTDMSNMFYNSKATTLDVSSFDTSNVTNMSYMFTSSQAKTIKVFENFDTSKVTDMSGMFSNSQATTLDVSNFNTSKVTRMSSMFSYSKATTLDVSNFNTSKVTDMNGIFGDSQATVLDVSNFDTSNVTDMSNMFSGSKATTLDVSNFNTSKVTSMYSMFSKAKVTTLDLSNFDTSNVTNMNYMFSGSQATTLDVSNFDTSKVTDMMYMFYNCRNLKTLYASDKFVTTNVTSDSGMFANSSNLIGGSGTVYDSTKTDKTYARIDGGTELPGYFTLKTN